MASTRDLVHNIKVTQTIAPGAKITATVAAAAGNAVDTAGYESCTFVVDPGAYTDGTLTFNVYDSDDNSTFTITTAVTSKTNVINGASPAAFAIGYTGAKRYVACAPVVTGSPVTGAAYGVVAVLGHPHDAPTY